MRVTERGLKRIIDLIGGTVIAACVVGFFWLLAVGSDRTRTEIAQLKRSVAKALADVRSVQAVQSRHEATLREYKSQLAVSGHLPAQAPIDEYFRLLSAIATEHSLRVLRHNPLPSRSYPGLLEQRYRYEVAGSTRGVVRFLEAIERTDFWADVSYLKIDAGSPRGGPISSDQSSPVDTRQALLTISLFSAPPQDKPVESAEDA